MNPPLGTIYLNCLPHAKTSIEVPTVDFNWPNVGLETYPRDLCIKPFSVVAVASESGGSGTTSPKSRVHYVCVYSCTQTGTYVYTYVPIPVSILFDIHIYTLYLHLYL